MPELKELIDKIQGAVELLHQNADTYHAEAKRFGEATGETKTALEKINVAIDGHKAQLDAVGLAVERAKLLTPGNNGAVSEEAKARSSAFFNWMRQGKSGMEPTERKALVEDATGRVMVPEDLEAEIIRAIAKVNVMRGLCTVRTTSRDQVRRRSMTEVSVGWGKLETGSALTESTLVPSEAYMYVEDLQGLSKIGKDELADTEVNLTALIADSFGMALSDAEETGYVIGTGHSFQQPAGLAVDSTLRTGLGSGCGAGAVGTYGISWATDDTVLINDILKAEYALPAQYLAGASWLMHRKTELAARILQASGTGAYLWQPSLQVGMPNQFDGFPIRNSSDMNYPADTLAKTNVVFGNFRAGYTILDRSGISIQRLDELYAEAGLVGFLATKRTSGGVVRPAAFQVIVNDV